MIGLNAATVIAAALLVTTSGTPAPSPDTGGRSAAEQSVETSEPTTTPDSGDADSGDAPEPTATPDSGDADSGDAPEPTTTPDDPTSEQSDTQTVTPSPNQDGSDNELSGLRKLIDELKAKIAELTGSKPEQPSLPEQPEQPEPSQTQAPDTSGFNLSTWGLQLPVDANGGNSPGCKVAEVSGANLATYQSEWFKPAEGGGYVFKAPTRGCTTPNSPRARSELRELNPDGSKAAWDAATGTHTMKLRQAITRMPTTTPRMITAQVHDGKTSAFALKADTKKGTGTGTIGLCYELSGKAAGCLDTGYVPGKPYDLEIVVENGRVRVMYNGAQKVDTELTSVTAANYFKAGAYPMSPTTDPEGEYGEVLISALSVSHSGSQAPTGTETETPSATPSETPTATPTAPTGTETTGTPTETATGTVAGAETYFLTGYSWWDNTPPGSSAIAYPVLHKQAAGVGTYEDPTTVAVGHSLATGKSVPNFAPGTKFYLVDKKRYMIVEDACGDGPTPQDGPCNVLPAEHKSAKAWLDVWVGGQSSPKTESDKCMDALTGPTKVVKDPPAGLPVTPGDLC